MPSLICKAVGGNRLSPDEGSQLLTAFHNLKLPTRRTRLLADRAFQTGLRYRCTFYDGLYIALAESLHTQFIHADARRRRTLNGRWAAELRIEDYAAHT